MALKHPDRPGLDYKEFKERIDLEDFNDAQRAMINMRLGLLESFLYQADVKEKPSQKTPRFEVNKKGKAAARDWAAAEDARRQAALGKASIWPSGPGSLTIVDLSCPFVDESAACVLFNICLALFLEQRSDSGRIIALDEAHKVHLASEIHDQR